MAFRGFGYVASLRGIGATAYVYSVEAWVEPVARLFQRNGSSHLVAGKDRAGVLPGTAGNSAWMLCGPDRSGHRKYLGRKARGILKRFELKGGSMRVKIQNKHGIQRPP